MLELFVRRTCYPLKYTKLGVITDSMDCYVSRLHHCWLIFQESMLIFTHLTTWVLMKERII